MKLYSTYLSLSSISCLRLHGVFTDEAVQYIPLSQLYLLFEVTWGFYWWSCTVHTSLWALSPVWGYMVFLLMRLYSTYLSLSSISCLRLHGVFTDEAVQYIPLSELYLLFEVTWGFYWWGCTVHTSLWALSPVWGYMGFLLMKLYSTYLSLSSISCLRLHGVFTDEAVQYIPLSELYLLFEVTWCFYWWGCTVHTSLWALSPVWGYMVFLLMRLYSTYLSLSSISCLRLHGVFTDEAVQYIPLSELYLLFEVTWGFYWWGCTVHTSLWALSPVWGYMGFLLMRLYSTYLSLSSISCLRLHGVFTDEAVQYIPLSELYLLFEVTWGFYWWSCTVHTSLWALSPVWGYMVFLLMRLYSTYLSLSSISCLRLHGVFTDEAVQYIPLSELYLLFEVTWGFYWWSCTVHTSLWALSPVWGYMGFLLMKAVQYIPLSELYLLFEVTWGFYWWGCTVHTSLWALSPVWGYMGFLLMKLYSTYLSLSSISCLRLHGVFTDEAVQYIPLSWALSPVWGYMESSLLIDALSCRCFHIPLCSEFIKISALRLHGVFTDEAVQYIPLSELYLLFEVRCGFYWWGCTVHTSLWALSPVWGYMGFLLMRLYSTYLSLSSISCLVLNTSPGSSGMSSLS